MFFSISAVEDSRFVEFTVLGTHIVSHDSGWELKEVQGQLVLFKGYIEVDTIDDVVQARVPSCRGSFTAIVVDHHNNLLVTHSKERSFPLICNDDQITNLEYQPDDERFRTIYPNEYIDSGNIIEYHPYEYNESNYSESDSIELIKNILVEKTICLKDKHVDIFLSGGADTILLYSLIRNQNISYAVTPGMQCTFDEFICKNLQRIVYKCNHWAYMQLHHFDRPAIVVSGAPGDEFFMRGPDTLTLWLAWHKVDINKIIDKKEYHSKYFARNSNMKKFAETKYEEIIEMCPTVDDLNKYILQINSNDYQHWHLSKTISWTPLRDSRITNIILNMPHDSMLKQISDAFINKELIKQLDHSVLKYMSTYKNTFNWEQIYEAIKNG